MAIAPTDGPMSLGDIAHAVDRAQAARAERNAQELSFDDLIDVINPLQHLPIVSSVYRALTGDEISPHARAVGGGLYGGPVGALAAGVTMAAEEAVGETSADLLADMLGVEKTDKTALASAPPAAEAPGQSAKAEAASVAQAAPPPIIVADPRSAPPPATAQPAPETTPAAPAAKTQPEPQTIPFVAKDRPRFFALPSARTVAAPAPAQKPQTPAAPPSVTPAAAAPVASTPAPGPQPMALTAAQGDLLDRFIAGGAKPSISPQPGAPANAASAEWLATQMQANFQKYVDSRRQGDG